MSDLTFTNQHKCVWWYKFNKCLQITNYNLKNHLNLATVFHNVNTKLEDVARTHLRESIVIPSLSVVKVRRGSCREGLSVVKVRWGSYWEGLWLKPLLGDSPHFPCSTFGCSQRFRCSTWCPASIMCLLPSPCFYSQNLLSAHPLLISWKFPNCRQ